MDYYTLALRTLVAAAIIGALFVVGKSIKDDLVLAEKQVQEYCDEGIEYQDSVKHFSGIEGIVVDKTIFRFGALEPCMCSYRVGYVNDNGEYKTLQACKGELEQ